MGEKPPRVQTTYLGQFSWERANAIAKELEAAGIAWWYKQAGTFSRIFFSEWGVRMFVDGSRAQEVREIVERTPEPPPGAQP